MGPTCPSDIWGNQTKMLREGPHLKAGSPVISEAAMQHNEGGTLPLLEGEERSAAALVAHGSRDKPLVGLFLRLHGLLQWTQPRPPGPRRAREKTPATRGRTLKENSRAHYRPRAWLAGSDHAFGHFAGRRSASDRRVRLRPACSLRSKPVACGAGSLDRLESPP